MKGISQQVASKWPINGSEKDRPESPRSPRTVSVPYRNLPEWIARACDFCQCTLPTPHGPIRRRYIEVFRSVLSQPHHICRSQCFQTKPSRAKRRKTNTKAAAAGNRVPLCAPRPLSTQSGPLHGTRDWKQRPNRGEEREQGSERERWEGLLPEYLEARQGLWARSTDVALFVRLLCQCPWVRCLHSHSCFAFVRYVRMTTRAQAG